MFRYVLFCFTLLTLSKACNKLYFKQGYFSNTYYFDRLLTFSEWFVWLVITFSRDIWTFRIAFHAFLSNMFKYFISLFLFAFLGKMSDGRRGWEFTDGIECLTYHDKNSSFAGKQSNLSYYWKHSVVDLLICGQFALKLGNYELSFSIWNCNFLLKFFPLFSLLSWHSHHFYENIDA